MYVSSGGVILLTISLKSLRRLASAQMGFGELTWVAFSGRTLNVGIIKRVCYFLVFEASVPPKSLSYSPRHEESWEVRAKLLVLVST